MPIAHIVLKIIFLAITEQNTIAPTATPIPTPTPTPVPTPTMFEQSTINDFSLFIGEKYISLKDWDY